MPADRIDPHTHSTVSDGTDTPAELVAKAAAAGLTAIGLSDHDTVDGWDEALAAGERHGIRVLRGIEMSCAKDGVSVHLLAFGCRPEDAELGAELARIRSGRSGRVATMSARLAEAGVPIPHEVLMRQVGDSPSIGRPHFADAMIELGYVASRQEAFDTWLDDDKPGFVPRYSTPVDRGIALVAAAGGASVIAHPWARSSRAVLGLEVLTELIRRGLDGVEVDHNDHDPATREQLRVPLRAAGALITGSSDYHGSGKNPDFALGCNTTDVTVVDELDRRIAARGGRW